MKDKFKLIKKHHQGLSNRIVNQLQLATPNHHVTSGTSRELIWLDVFENIVPKKFKIAQSVFLIDSFGEISKEVDLAIYDEQYTPYIFNYGNILFIPIEAVLAVVQSKSVNLEGKVLIKWAESIERLKPVLNGYNRMHTKLLNTRTTKDAQTQTATRPIQILCTLNLFKIDKNNKLNKKIRKHFDIVLHLDENQQLTKEVDNKRMLASWSKELNHYRLERYGAGTNRLDGLVRRYNTDRTLEDLIIKDSDGTENVLLTLKLQLNQLLMLINNPIFFPHASYVDLFNRELKKQVKKEGVEEMANAEDNFLLAVYDITGIQEYIFASNHMKENAGASFIVGEMVKTYFVEILKDLSEGKAITEWENQNVQILEGKGIAAEVVYIGGGNALVIYRDWSLYHKVNERFALKVLEESASLTMATEAIPFQENDGRTYRQLYEELMKKLAETKAKQIRTQLNQTLPIFAQESFKGNAITNKTDNLYVSTEQYLKRHVKRNRSILTNDDERFVIEIEDLKRKVGEDSYIAVVHIDGNGIGDWIKSGLGKAENDKVLAIKKHRQLSKEITKQFKEIFEETVEIFFDEEKKFPMRPLIIDGDDVTFICRADLAIPFTQAFLKKLEKRSKEIRACAGVAFVHSHFPFELAYEIAEACCQNAKKSYYEDPSLKKSYFDFYVVRGSYVKTMAEQREHQSNLEPRKYDVEKLKGLQALIVKLNVVDESPENRSWPRSRLIALYEAYLRSHEDVQLVKDEAESRGYKEIHPDQRMLFDALQLIDFGKDEEWTNCLNTN